MTIILIKQLARREQIYLIKHPETAMPGRGKNQHTGKKVPSAIVALGTTKAASKREARAFAEDTAAKTGKTARTIERAVSVAGMNRKRGANVADILSATFEAVKIGLVHFSTPPWRVTINLWGLALCKLS